MKVFPFLVFGLIISQPIVAQNVSQFDTILSIKKDELKTIQMEIEELQKRSKTLSLEIHALEQKKLVSIVADKDDNVVVIRLKCKVYSRPSVKSEILSTLEKGATVVLLELLNGTWVKVMNDGQEGYLMKDYLLESNLLVKLEKRFNAKIVEEQNHKDSIENAEKQKELINESLALEERRNELIVKFGKTNADRILEGFVWLGMTEEMAIESIGKPQDRNRTVGSWGVHEQWVYDYGTYLYFENGKLTSWQD